MLVLLLLVDAEGVSRVLQQADDTATATVSQAALLSVHGIAGSQAYMAPDMLNVLRRVIAVRGAHVYVAHQSSRFGCCAEMR